jgi:hypothetical protein
VSVEHSSSSLAKDEKAILNELTSSRVFDYIPGRKHRSFKSIVPNLSLTVNKEKLFGCINNYKRQIQQRAAVAKLFNHKF